MKVFVRNVVAIIFASWMVVLPAWTVDGESVLYNTQMQRAYPEFSENKNDIYENICTSWYREFLKKDPVTIWYNQHGIYFRLYMPQISMYTCLKYLERVYIRHGMDYSIKAA